MQVDTIDPAKAAMIVVDMQNDFVAAGAPMETPAARTMVPKLAEALKICRDAGIRVIYTAYAHRRDGLFDDMHQRTFPRRLRRALDGAVVRHLDGRPDPRFRLAALGSSRRCGQHASIDLGQPPLHERRHFLHARVWDLVPQTRLGRLISVLEAGTGLGFIALVIGYLPVLYQLFSRREAHVIKLDGRAGSPPTALGLLRPLHRVHPEIRQAVSPPGRRDPGGSARICRGGPPGPLPCGRAHLFAVDGDTPITSVKPTPANGAASMRSSFLTPRWRKEDSNSRSRSIVKS
jgi:hypothetical protein